MSISTNSKFYKFISGKGFYVALAACLIGTGAAAWVGVNQALGGLEEPLTGIESSSQSQAEWEMGLESAQESVPDIPKTPVTQPDTPAKPEQTPEPISEPEPTTKPAETQPASAEQAEIPVQQNKTSTFALPLEGEQYNLFSDGKLVKSATLNDWRTHNGVDIRAAKGAKVLAAADGKITRVTQDKLWGTIIEISHEGSIISRYCGLGEELTLKEGQNVKQGDTIGTIGLIACESADGPHLHFEILRDGKLIDPLTILH